MKKIIHRVVMNHNPRAFPTLKDYQTFVLEAIEMGIPLDTSVELEPDNSNSMFNPPELTKRFYMFELVEEV